MQGDPTADVVGSQWASAVTHLRRAMGPLCVIIRVMLQDREAVVIRFEEPDNFSPSVIAAIIGENLQNAMSDHDGDAWYDVASVTIEIVPN